MALRCECGPGIHKLYSLFKERGPQIMAFNPFHLVSHRRFNHEAVEIGFFFRPGFKRRAESVSRDVLVSHAPQCHQQGHVREWCVEFRRKDNFVIVEFFRQIQDFNAPIGERNLCGPSSSSCVLRERSRPCLPVRSLPNAHSALRSSLRPSESGTQTRA